MLELSLGKLLFLHTCCISFAVFSVFDCPAPYVVSIKPAWALELVIPCQGTVKLPCKCAVAGLGPIGI